MTADLEAAIAEADLILFVVDIREELMPLDEEVAQRLRYINTPVILVMNKADTLDFDNRGAEFYKLGRGKPIAVSGRGHQRRRECEYNLDRFFATAAVAVPAPSRTSQRTPRGAA